MAKRVGGIAAVGGMRDRDGEGLSLHLPPVESAVSDVSAQEAAARESDAVMLKKLPAGSRAFVERQRRARALNNGDEAALRMLGAGDGNFNYKIAAKGAAAPYRVNGGGNAGANAVARARMGAQREGAIEREAKIQVCSSASVAFL
jgi:hypothetical protein